MHNNQANINKLQEMRISVLRILASLKSTDAGDIQRAMEEYVDIVDRFYHDYQHLMAPQQYREAKQNIEYFMRLLDLAIQYEATGEQR